MSAEPNVTIRPQPRAPLPTMSQEEFERAPENQPRGITPAIIFDWSLAAFLVALCIVAAAQRGPRSQQAAAAALLAVVLGLPLIALGEALRRGKRPARTLQVITSGLLGALNVVGLIRDISLLLQGTWPGAFNLTALVAGITIIWGLTRPQTIAWFARISSAQARARRGPRWIALAGLASIAIGAFWCVVALQ
jgi:hypothetical protein